jgi:hypothetical protein
MNKSPSSLIRDPVIRAAFERAEHDYHQTFAIPDETQGATTMNDRTSTSRRAVLAGIAAAPALAAPALALTSAGLIRSMPPSSATARQRPPTSRRLMHKGPLRGVWLSRSW